MDLELSGKVAVVTVASKGIGLAIVKALAAEGAHVVAGARTVASLEGMLRVTPLAVDLASAEGPGRLVARAIEQHRRVDVLINNMGAVRLRCTDFSARATRNSSGAADELLFGAARHAPRAQAHA